MKSTRASPARRNVARLYRIGMIACAMFGVLAFDVMRNGDITLLDLRLARWFHAHANEGLTRFMLGLADMHSVAGIFALSALSGVYFYRERAWYWLTMLFVVVPGGMLLNVSLKHAFGRVRPSFDDPILSLHTFSFPSGHTSSATVLYGLLAAYFACRTTSRHWRMASVAGAVLMAALVGLSRLCLGVHYFSDVLAALLEGCAWLTLCLAIGADLYQRGASDKLPDH